MTPRTMKPTMKQYFPIPVSASLFPLSSRRTLYSKHFITSANFSSSGLHLRFVTTNISFTRHPPSLCRSHLPLTSAYSLPLYTILIPIGRAFCSNSHSNYELNFDHNKEKKECPISRTLLFPVSTDDADSSIVLDTTKDYKITARLCAEKETSNTVVLNDDLSDSISDSDSDSDSDTDGYTDIPLLHSIDRKIINNVISKLSIKTPNISKRLMYVQFICNLLEEKKKDISFDPNRKDILLNELQFLIEKSTILFDEKSIYKSSMDLFDKLTCDPVTLKKRSSNMRNLLTETLKDEYIIDVLNTLDVYTVEILVIYALGQIFNDLGNDSPLIKTVTLIDKLGKIVLRERIPDNEAYTLDSEDESLHLEPVVDMDKKIKILGGALLNILISKGLLAVVDHPTDKISNNSYTYTYKKYSYIKCLYDLSLVPVKLNLPMVVPPIPWHIETKESDKTGKVVITALRGGYLTDSVDVYYRYRLISSKNPELFKLRMTVRSEDEYLPVISLLQSVRFRIDDSVLEFLTKNWDKLKESKLVSDDGFIGINPDSFVSELKNSVNFQYSALLHEFMAESYKARNEQNVLSIAKAYSGYDLYFPAFQDFRGRVYRTGIFNLHECDLYRSLLVFRSENSSFRKLSVGEIPSSIKAATAKRYSSSFKNDEYSIKWFDQWYSNLKNRDIDDYVIESMKKAKDPFQFMRKALLTLKGGYFESEPVFMDASSSAYQIMAYLLQDAQIASNTNLINGDIRYDLYMILREDYLKYLRDGNHLNPRLEPYFTRKLIKKIFMPITYGKTVKAIADDIYDVLRDQISYKNCMKLGKESFHYWCIRYKDLHNLLKLFGNVGYLCSSLGRGVKLSTPLFYSYQDYRKFEKQSVWIYSNRKGKEKRTRHKISFNVLTTKRNVMKSKCATLANFIHQKDALIAVNTIRSFYEAMGKAPIYTVHDCFVSNYVMSEKMADIYKETLFQSLGNPMELINVFLLKNLITPNYPNYMNSDYADDKLEFMRQNPITPESHYLCKSDPIPAEHLEIFVQKWIESGAKKNFKEHAYEVIECYNNYVRSLCGRVIDRVSGNKDFAKELLDQRTTLKKRMSQFRSICFNKLNGKKNYSLT